MKQWIINCSDTGDVITYLNGLVHSRGDEPAVTTLDGFNIWFYKGTLHRRNGPAVLNYGMDIREYWIHGKRIR